MSHDDIKRALRAFIESPFYEPFRYYLALRRAQLADMIISYPPTEDERALTYNRGRVYEITDLLIFLNELPIGDIDIDLPDFGAHIDAVHKRSQKQNIIMATESRDSLVKQGTRLRKKKD